MKPDETLSAGRQNLQRRGRGRERGRHRDRGRARARERPRERDRPLRKWIEQGSGIDELCEHGHDPLQKSGSKDILLVVDEASDLHDVEVRCGLHQNA